MREKDLKKILIFAGTTEGRRLAEVLAEAQVPCVVCVATEYGAQVMREHALIELMQGRLDAAGMQKLMEGEAFLAVVDATHPFAVAVSENIRVSAEKVGVPYLRLQRNTCTENALENALVNTSENASDLYYFKDHTACAEFLTQTKGNVLLTTGSKELAAYCAENSLRERLYARVLPGVESIRLCDQAGLPGSRILALQGPFSEELNLAVIKQYGISWMVTKESGHAGGYEEKLAAARKAGISVCVIGNPEKAQGLSFAQTLEQIRVMTGSIITQRRRLRISLIGMGMGSRDGITVGALEACGSAAYVFGAKRLLAMAEQIGAVSASGAKQYPYYLAEDILPHLDRVMEENKNESSLWENDTEVAVLFSGDSGFYSGCEKLCRELREWAKRHEAADETCRIAIQIYPGISSVSCMAAAVGVSWQDAGIFSTHGKGTKDVWAEALLKTVRSHEKTFVLTSGVEDVREIGALMEREMERIPEYQILIVTGCALSYPEQEVAERTPRECMALDKEGIYTCLILRDTAAGSKIQITHGLPDSSFIRGGTPLIPMTKEEVREVAVSKLHLTADAVVYDIGSGTGSVAVEIGRCHPDITVYALEHKETAARLIQQNVEKFDLDNIRVVNASAPEGFEELPAPTHAFIGGSDGRLKEILNALRRKSETVRVVVTAVSLETVAELTDRLSETYVEAAEVVQMQVSRAKLLGSHHLMQAENPVYVISFDLMGERAK